MEKKYCDSLFLDFLQPEIERTPLPQIIYILVEFF